MSREVPSSGPAGEDGRSRRLEKLFAECLDRLNAGQVLDRQELMETAPELADELFEQLREFEALRSDRLQLATDRKPLGVLGDYTLRRELGRGGMGVVYEAWQGSMDRAVALKILPPGIAADSKAFHRFMREAKTAGQLSHQNIVGVHSTGVEEGTPWYSMELVEGETLAQVLLRIERSDEDAETPFGKTSEQQYYLNLAKSFADVADGLQHAHSRGVIHRDIKPSNLILDPEGKLRILDFGLARLEGQASLTFSGDLTGTVLYMSPEQAMAKRIPLDHRTDVYSLGATLYEAMTGEPPLRGKSQHDTLSQIIVRDPRPPRQLNPRIPKDLETIVLKCLRKDPADRYGTAEALAQDCRRLVRGDPIEARPLAAWEVLARRVRRHRVRLGVAVVVFVLVVACGVLSLRLSEKNRLERQARYESGVVEAAMELIRGETVLMRESVLWLGDQRRVLLERGRTVVEDAVRKLEAIVALDSDRFEAHFYRAQGLRLLGRNEDAARELEAALEIDREFVPARILRAFLTAGEWPQPLADSGIPSWGAVWTRAFRAETESRFDRAIEAYDELILLDRGTDEGLYLGSTLELHLRRGALRLRVRNFEDARLDFVSAQTHAGDFMEPELLWGKSYLMEGDAGRAQSVFEALHARHRNRGDSALWIAVVCASENHLIAALDWARRIPDEESRLRMEAPLLASLGRLDEAAASYRRMLIRSPRDAEVHIGLARVLIDQLGGVSGIRAMRPAPELTNVFELLGRACERAPENPYVDHILGSLRLAIGELDRARALFDSATRKGQKTPEKRLMNKLGTELAAVAALSLGATASAHEGSWENVRPVVELNSFEGEYDNVISPDGLEMYFGRCCNNTIGSTDIWIARRDSLNQPFGEARHAGTPLNSSSIDNATCFSDDGLELYMYSGRPLPGAGGMNIYVARRDAFGEDFSEPMSIKELNSGSDDNYATLAPEGFEMVFASRRPGGGGGDLDLWLASRPDKTAPWEVVGPVTNLNTLDKDRAAVFSSDGRTLFFDRWVGNRGAIWCATRNLETGLFENPQLLQAEINGGRWNGNTNLSPFWPADGSELFWTRCIGSDCDIYTATWRSAVPRFLRGDCNNDGDVNLSDATCALERLFAGAEQGCAAALNVNGDLEVDLADPVSLLNYLFSGGAVPVAPFPECGAGELPADKELGCESSPGCVP